jgi:phosphoglycerate dehydrogenase-like enzyme
LGIIGFGSIGSAIANQAKAIGMEVVYWNRTKLATEFKQVNEISDIFTSVDFLTVCLPENEETRSLIKKEHIDMMKKSAIIIGLNRIKLLMDEEYIISKVANGELFGYGFEGDDAQSPTTYKGNVWAVPPVAWFTDESIDSLNQIWIENIKNYIDKKETNRIDI